MKFEKKVAKFEKVSKKQWELSEGVIPYEEIKLPTRATEDSAGYDFYITKDTTLKPGETTVVDTGIRVHIYTPGWCLFIMPKSGLGFKYQLSLANTIGLIDADYYYADNEGHIKVKLVNRGDKEVTLEAGSKFVQGVFLQYGITLNDQDDDKKVRTGGFGSTGSN